MESSLSRQPGAPRSARGKWLALVAILIIVVGTVAWQKNLFSTSGLKSCLLFNPDGSCADQAPDTTTVVGVVGTATPGLVACPSTDIACSGTVEPDGMDENGCPKVKCVENALPALPCTTADCMESPPGAPPPGTLEDPIDILGLHEAPPVILIDGQPVTVDPTTGEIDFTFLTPGPHVLSIDGVEEIIVVDDPICGDELKNQPTEECDALDGIDPTNPHQSCSAECKIVNTPFCGDNVVNNGEACDGAQGSNGPLGTFDTCSVDCKTITTAPHCGDGAKNQPNEQCDDGNIVNGDGCSATCTTEARCGDGAVNQPTEECDGAQGPNGPLGANQVCSAQCKLTILPVCGNGVKEATERCDDGNTNPADAATGDICSATCDKAFGIVKVIDTMTNKKTGAVVDPKHAQVGQRYIIKTKKVLKEITL